MDICVGLQWIFMDARRPARGCRGRPEALLFAIVAQQVATMMPAFFTTKSRL